MNNPSRTTEWLVWGGLVAVIAAIAGAFVVSRTRSIESSAPPLPVLAPVAEFNLTNQASQPVTLADLRGQVWIADIIFTRCAGPCPEMTRKMSGLQAALPAGLPVKLVTLTTDPDFDTPEVLKKYPARLGVTATDRWIFLTGSKTEIYKLAVGSLKLTAIEKKPDDRETPVDLFVHSTIFVLVDARGQLRGVFQTTGEDVEWSKVKREILGAAQKLAREK